MTISLDRLAPPAPYKADGFAYPAPRHPSYLLQERATTVEELLPLARTQVRRRYGRSALDIVQGDHVLVLTYPHQNDLVFETIRAAMREEGVAEVSRLDVTDLGVEVQEYSAADGWREISDKLAPMVERGVVHSVAAMELKRYLDDHPQFTGVYTGESGRRHWKRVAGDRIRNNWLFSTYEDIISRSNMFPDELWALIDLKVVEQFRGAAHVHITSPEGTDISWDVTPEQADLWVRGAWQSGHIIGSTIQGIRFGHPVSTFMKVADQLLSTVNGVVAGTSNHTGYFPYAEVEIERGMIADIRGGGRYGELWREVVDRFKDAEYPGFPWKGWAYFNDASIGTNPKSHRQIETLWKYNDSRTNLPERAQAGVIHFGFGAEHWDEVFLRYARENGLPTMHFPHIHNVFCTYEIERHDGSTVRVIDEGRLTVLDDPAVVRLANSLGGPGLLEYDWIPTIPGINHPGDYRRDYGPDPVSWIRRDQLGEFAGL
jgi:hypothetical protein